MSKSLLNSISSKLKSFGEKFLMVEDPSNFLLRADIVKLLASDNIIIYGGNLLSQRVAFELNRSTESTFIFILSNNEMHMEDVSTQTGPYVFILSDFIKGYDIGIVKDKKVNILDYLYSNPLYTTLSKARTKETIKNIEGEEAIDIEEVEKRAEEINLLLTDDINWLQMIELISGLMLDTVHTSYYSIVKELIAKINVQFQEHINSKYGTLQSSSFINHPRIVSHVLPHISSQYKGEKIAILVVDGMAYWQYMLFRSKLHDETIVKETTIHSWIPSITQLSRQALFKGTTPSKTYRQGPVNEERLWKNFWEAHSANTSEILYLHEPDNLQVDNRITKLAIVFKELDEKMHSSTDYRDLLSLTRNWLKRSNIISVIHNLLNSGFTIFMTTDHGNIESQGWRRLTQQESLNTHRSGSRSQRHLEYNDISSVSMFMEENSELSGSITVDEKTLYFKDDLSFSSEKSLVSHGGSHFLEVLIPFVKITKK